MKRYRVNKHDKYICKRIFCFIIIIILVFTWLISYIRINRAFPKAEQIVYEYEKPMEIDGLKIELAESSKVDNASQIIEKYNDENIIAKLQKSKKSYRYIYIKLNVYNESEEDKNIEALLYSFIMECMPSGWSNGANSECSKMKLESGEMSEIKMSFALNIPDTADISNEEFHLVYRTYPQKIMFKIDV